MWTFSQILKWFDLCGPLAEFWLGPLAEFWPNLTYADHQPNFVLIWPMLTLGQILTWYDFRGPLPYFWLDLTYFEACELKKSHKAEKVYNFLDPPPSPRVFWTLLNLGKIGSLTTPPPLGPNLGKFWNWEDFEFSEPPLKTRNISLKHLELPKNHFKYKFFYVHLKSAFPFGEKMKISA